MVCQAPIPASQVEACLGDVVAQGRDSGIEQNVLEMLGFMRCFWNSRTYRTIYKVLAGVLEFGPVE